MELEQETKEPELEKEETPSPESETSSDVASDTNKGNLENDKEGIQNSQNLSDTKNVAEEPGEAGSEAEDEQPSESLIFIIKVTTNKEDRALELISDKVHKKNLSVFSLARPHGLRGYIFLEAADKDSAEEAAYNLPYVKGIIGKTVSYEEIKNMLEPVMEEINIEKSDIVEIIGEPFKKEKAKVIRVDKSKGEAVVTLLAAVVPIPVTVKLDNVKVIRRDKEEGETSEGEGEEGIGPDDTSKKSSGVSVSEEEAVPLGADEPKLDYEEQSGGLIPEDF